MAKPLYFRGNPLVRLHTRLVDFPPSCESAASQYRVGLVRFASGRVLVFHGGVFGCSSRMNGKPSSPVLRGLGASNGARLLDPNLVTSELPVRTKPPGKFSDSYFLGSLLSANFTAVSSASPALTFTSGSTPTSAQSDFEKGLMAFVSGMPIPK